MKKKEINPVIIFFIVIGIVAIVFTFINKISDVEKTSFYNICGISCTKVEINKDLVKPLQCLNNYRVRKINLAYSGMYLDMFVNYKNSLKQVDRLNVKVKLTDSDFMWDWEFSGNEPLPNYIDRSDIVGKLSFRSNKVILVTPDKSLTMNKDMYLKYINQLGERMCKVINIREAEIKQNKKQKEELIQDRNKNIESWK